MKIGDVARETGLSEKAIRLYVENGLVKPQVTQTMHRNAYDFSRENVKELERISIFRKAGFSLFEISVIIQQPERLPELLESKRQSMEADLEIQESVKDALSRLQASEIGDVDQVTKNLRFAVANRKPERKRGSRRWIYVTVILVALVGFYLWMHYIGIYKSFRGWVPLDPLMEYLLWGMLCLILSVPSLFMAVRYATCTRRAGKLPRHGVGTITAVMEEHGFDGSYARAGMASSGTRGPGIGGTWQINFMLWNEIRPDTYFPVVRYTDENGKEVSNTFDYGGFKKTWNVGDEVRISWDPQRKRTIYPLEGSWLTKKAVLYGIVGLIFLAVSIWLLGQANTLLLAENLMI